MTTVTIELSDEQVLTLEQRAKRLGISLEAILQLSIEDFIARSDDRFDQAVAYVLEKNADLYRRLA